MRRILQSQQVLGYHCRIKGAKNLSVKLENGTYASPLAWRTHEHRIVLHIWITSNNGLKTWEICRYPVHIASIIMWFLQSLA